MNLQENIKKVLREELNESTYFRRRIDMDLFEKEFYETLNYTTNIFLRYRDGGVDITFPKFKRRVMDYLIDNYHSELTNGGLYDDYPYDEVFEYLSEFFHDKIKDRYTEVFGGDVNESVKRSLNETKNKFNRGDSKRGEYSDLLESLTMYFFNEENVCDVFAMYTDGGTYAVLVYYNGNAGYYQNDELDEFLTKYAPTDLFSHIINTKCDKE